MERVDWKQLGYMIREITGDSKEDNFINTLINDGIFVLCLFFFCHLSCLLHCLFSTDAGQYPSQDVAESSVVFTASDHKVTILDVLNERDVNELTYGDK